MHGIYAVIGQDRGEIFWWQMVIRGIIIFVYGLILLRIAGLRAFGRHSALDIVLTVLIGSNLSRALTAGAPFCPTMAATAAIVGLYWLSIHVTQRSDLAGWVMKGHPVQLVRDGQVDDTAMKSSGISHLDLHEACREAHVDDLESVQHAILERSGKISIIPRKPAHPG
jgi:uncharacterized membrane protein YcaP (DUF421 family)